jgi:hypothetical protein
MTSTANDLTFQTAYRDGDIFYAIIQNLQKTKCDPTYNLRLMPYRHRDAGSAVYDELSDEYDVILCLYHNNKCVSSVTGRYNKRDHSMELLSKTDPKYEGLKYNIYLRTVFIFLMCFSRPAIQKIVSHATNPISTYAMYKYFNAVNPDLTEYVSGHGLSRETFTVANAKDFHNYVTDKYSQTRESAEQELEDMLEDCRETFDTDCDVSDLGWATREEAIAFILTTMSFKTVTLELNLDESIKRELYNQIMRMDIKCGEKSLIDKKSISGGKSMSGGKITMKRKSKKHNNTRRKK